MQQHSDFIVFADESGDHSLTNVSREYPVFVLSFCIFRKTDYIENVYPRLQRFKLRWWEHEAVVLHSMRISRQERPFVFLKSIEKRERSDSVWSEHTSFYLQIADLVSTPIGRHVSQPQRQNRAFEMIQQKFDRTPNGDFMGRGLQVFP